MSSPAILNLKRKALECKKAGDIDGAKDCLRIVQQIQALQTTAAADNPDQLKQLALLLKQNGDLQGAKEALQKSKDVVMEDPVNQASDDATLEELTTSATTEFSAEEMADVETMADMKAAGMSIPTKEEYMKCSLKCKEQAVAAKNAGDIPAAKRYLLQYKQLEAAIATLFADKQEDDDQDYSLLDELYNDGTKQQQDDGFFEQLFGIESTAVELDDLDDLDPSMLRDMMDSGMTVSDVDDVLQNAKEKKAAAIQFKKAGNLVAAKAALEESKRLEMRATQLRNMIQAAEKLKDGESADYSTLDPEAALEAMLQASEDKPKQQQTAPPLSKQEPLKSSHEYKVQAVTCKKEGRVQEAVAALQLYKQALAIENNAKKDELRKECIAQLQEELKTATQQSLKFAYYKRFVDAQMGSAQLEAWDQYKSLCMAVMNKLQSGGEPQILNRTKSGMKEITNDDLSFIGESIDPAEQRIEITILEVVDLRKNKNLRQLLNVPKNEEAVIPEGSSIRIHVTVQLPPSEKAPDDNVELEYKPQSRVDESYLFESCQYASTERGPSRFAKLVARRMNRKRILFQVFYVSPKKKLFSRATEETLLGTAVIQLKDLLETNVISNEFPLLDKTRQHELGGLARIAIRSGASFGETKEAIKKEQSPVANTGTSSGAAARIEPYAAYEFAKAA